MWNEGKTGTFTNRNFLQFQYIENLDYALNVLIVTNIFANNFV